MLEALYECLADDKTLYDNFCDRLDADLIPFLTQVNGGIKKLEYPLPPNHLFSVKQGNIEKKKDHRIKATDQFFSQDFTDNVSETDFSVYN